MLLLTTVLSMETVTLKKYRQELSMSLHRHKTVKVKLNKSNISSLLAGEKALYASVEFPNRGSQSSVQAILSKHSSMSILDEEGFGSDDTLILNLNNDL